MKLKGRYYVTSSNPNMGKGYEKNSGKSQTVPDQTMTIQTIMDRYARGLPLGGYKEPIYMDDDADPEDELPELRGQRIDQVELYVQIKEEAERLKKQNDANEERLKEGHKKYPKKTPPEAGQTYSNPDGFSRPTVAKSAESA